ncbi:MAG: glycosyltransferase family 2 protein [Deltaproteobacteria bacterium]|nr:glycosyltransferase family 2 protein [Deltaproteobacteria bacterium]
MMITENSKNISIALMAYNEGANIAAVVSDLKESLGRIDGTHEIIIINDGSSDNTKEIAEKLSEEFKIVRTVNHTPNMGLGAVYRTGFKEAKGDYLTFWPADGQFDTDIIKDFTSQTDKCDLVLGYLPNRKRGVIGSTLSFGEKTLYRILFGKMPKFQGVLMLKTSMLKDINLISEGRGWAVLIEFIIKAKKQNYKIKSIPTDLSKRASGKSKVTNIKTVISNLSQIIELKFKI